MRKSEPFGMHQEIISGMSPSQNPWVELARDDPETLNWMIQGKCEEK